MSFKIVLLGPDVDESWPQKIRQAVPGAAASTFRDPREALLEIEDADAAYGTVPPELLARAKKLRWICAARAGLGGDWFYDALVKSDVVVTNMRGMFDTRLFAKMKRGAYFINIARGGCVVTEDLIAALSSGHLAGAGLDVAAPEPLPSDSPLWTMPNVLITPHVAISGAPYRQKWEEILLENCRRFAGNQPLLNVVDKEQWY